MGHVTGQALIMGLLSSEESRTLPLIGPPRVTRLQGAVLLPKGIGGGAGGTDQSHFMVYLPQVFTDVTYCVSARVLGNRYKSKETH